MTPILSVGLAIAVAFPSPADQEVAVLTPQGDDASGARSARSRTSNHLTHWARLMHPELEAVATMAEALAPELRERNATSDSIRRALDYVATTPALQYAVDHGHADDVVRYLAGGRNFTRQHVHHIFERPNEIKNVAPPSSSTVITICVIFIVIAAIVFCMDVCFPLTAWSKVRRNYLKLQESRARRSQEEAQRLLGAKPTWFDDLFGRTMRNAGAPAEKDPSWLDEILGRGTRQPLDAKQVDNESKMGSPRRWSVFVIMLMAVVATDLGYTMMPNFYPGEAEKAGLTPAFVGPLFGCVGITSFFSSLIVLPLLEFVVRAHDRAAARRLSDRRPAASADPRPGMSVHTPLPRVRALRCRPRIRLESPRARLRRRL